MKVLIVHPEDGLPSGQSRWDLIVDIARAPRSTYQDWRRRAGGRAISLWEYACEIDDLYCTRDLLKMGLGRLLDGYGIDWWDVSSLMISPDLQRFVVARRMLGKLGDCELHATRDSAFLRGIEAVIGRKVIVERHPTAFERLSSRISAVRQLDRADLLQVLQDKFDSNHQLRRRLAKRSGVASGPVVLAPSAYVNVSHAVARHARSNPETQFYLVLARRTAQIAELPHNVEQCSLDRYFRRSDRNEIRSLQTQWNELRLRLASSSEELLMADAAGVFRRIPSLLNWGVAVRDAWLSIFEQKNVQGCFCADDSNPYSRVPLILARKRRLPATVSHHGALDSRLAFKRFHADSYLVKSEMEMDYAVRVCGVPADRLRREDSPDQVRPQPPEPWQKPRCLVFFTEAYHSAGCREEEIYRELIPGLLAAAKQSDLELVLKLHPFDSVKKIRRLLDGLSSPESRAVQLWAGPMTEERWWSTRVVVTGQSSIVIESKERGIPVFLCEWLRDPLSGYLKQLASYGFGTVLHAPEQMATIPELLDRSNGEVFQSGALDQVSQLVS